MSEQQLKNWGKAIENLMMIADHRTFSVLPTLFSSVSGNSDGSPNLRDIEADLEMLTQAVRMGVTAYAQVVRILSACVSQVLIVTEQYSTS